MAYPMGNISNRRTRSIETVSESSTPSSGSSRPSITGEREDDREATNGYMTRATSVDMRADTPQTTRMSPRRRDPVRRRLEFKPRHIQMMGIGIIIWNNLE